MKITKAQLKRIIKEELSSELAEADEPQLPGLADKEIAIAVAAMILGSLTAHGPDRGIPMEEIGSDLRTFEILLNAIARDQNGVSQDWMKLSRDEFRQKYIEDLSYLLGTSGATAPPPPQGPQGSQY